METLLVRGGEVVTPLARFRCDILCADGVIREMGRDLPGAGHRVVDATGRLVLPGVIDVHTHMQLPMGPVTSSDDFFTGTRAAAFGGVTTIIDFTEAAAGSDLLPALRRRRALADGRVAVDYGLHACLRGWSKATEAAIPRLVAAGVTSFKMFTVYKERGLMSSDPELLSALETVTRHGGMVTVHSENDGLVDLYTRRVLAQGERGAPGLAASRPNLVEAEAVGRVVTLAEAVGGRVYVVHLSTREGLRAVVDARRRGVNVTAETCPQYLVLDASALTGPSGHHNTCVPPLRSPMDNLALWEGLAEGELAVVATDHCPFTRRQKDRGRRDFRRLPLGLPGVETLLPLTWTHGVVRGTLSVNQLVQVLSANPAMIFGLYPRKGTIQPGSDADLVVVDPGGATVTRAKRLHMATDYSPYEGMRLAGWPLTTILRGKVIVDHGRYLGSEGDGTFLHRDPCSP